MFEVADVDESGELDGDEFCRALQNGGINLSREGLTALVSIVDANSDGNISREEWKQAIALYLERKQRKVLSIRKGEQFENDV